MGLRPTGAVGSGPTFGRSQARLPRAHLHRSAHDGAVTSVQKAREIYWAEMPALPSSCTLRYGAAVLINRQGLVSACLR